MSITLDGIAKGYIVDRASHLLQACGMSNHLINTGGDIRTCGSAAKGRAWRVAVEDPEGCECFVIAKDGSSVRSMGWHT